MITNAERDQMLAYLGLNLTPGIGFTGGATPSGQRSMIAQSMPFALASSSVTLATGVMTLTAIYIPGGLTITNINTVTGATAESGGSHCWFALYDDGRGTGTANQLALLAQTADQVGATFMAANTNMGLALSAPFVTTYSGVYYVAIMVVGTTPTIAGIIKASTGAANMGLPLTAGGVANTGLFWSATAGSALTTAAPNPSGALTAVTGYCYVYVS